ncbi:glycoside hydrolase family 2 TIM barrel-domain containing protein [Flavivirga amylovorans]|uniref:Glycoside hydrolase family 2 TIM barrel-domain containing protein n=1 Tax=Flavivirga amylovorans TaxID=870486 RepID=A0ABT8WVX7_9FLAO|nr:sugar-binding domain-containing protein [Flavivirga amylovorans]MDO5985831.1 glycoside hydrolase family 2 TIM barrel-domain containing protein [Flavivirga amylovorans]
MKNTSLRFIILVSFLTSLNLVAQEKKILPEFSKAGFWEVENAGRKTYNFNVGWRFKKADIKGAHEKNFDDAKWTIVNTPHGLEYNASEASGSVNYQGPAWYRKHFTVNENLKGKLLKIHFESVMGKSKIWLNGHQIGEHYGGYLPFVVTLNKYLVEGDNVLAVWADNSDDKTYPPGKEQTRLDFAYFGGIYRDVWLVATNQVYITNPNEVNKVAGGGVFTHVDEVSPEKATLSVKVDIQNDSETTAKLKAIFNIVNPEGVSVAKSEQNVTVKKGKSSIVKNIFTIENPSLWTPWSPDLYKVGVLLVNTSNQNIDGVAIKTGLRKIEFKGAEGFFLNNKPYPGKLIGANRHQDHGYVGNAIPNSGQWRDAALLKNAGFDVIRAAHYPADPAFMDACDALGLFYIEATPGWHFFDGKSEVFVNRVYSDVRNMVRRIRNYASVIMWEPVLNETNYSAEFAKSTHDLVHEEYPYQGAFTVCDNRGAGHEYYDVVYGQDYNADFNKDKRCYFTREFGDNVDDFNAQNSPSRVFRGWGETPQLVQAKTYADGDFDKYTTLETMYNMPPQFLGGALWCGFDHQRGYNPDPFYGGVADVFRQTKYSYHMFASQKDISETNKPIIFIANEMTPFSGSDVTVFTNCEEVRLTVYDGQKIIQKMANVPKYVRVLTPHGQPNRREKVGTKAIPHPYVTFKDVFSFRELKSMHRGGKKYEATIVAEGIVDGKVVTSFKRVSGKHPTKIKLSIENRKTPLVADGSDFMVVTASMVDEKGNIKRLNESMIQFEISGEAAIIGDAQIQANPKRLSWGTAPVLIRSTVNAGKIKVKASLLHEGVNTALSGELVFESVPSKDKLIYSEIGVEANTNANASIEETSEEKLKKKVMELEKKIIELKLKEEEKNQLEFDENR